MLASKNLTYDIVGINTEHLETAIKITKKCPGLKMVLDHLNQPPVASKEKFGKWGELIKEASQHTNLYAKISGLGTTASNGKNWTKEDLKPYILYAIELFGIDRCFCGGDWPVCLLAGTYETALLTYRQIFTEEFNDEEKERLLYKNAMSFYNLS
jgi:L-fuconolactonase